MIEITNLRIQTLTNIEFILRQNLYRFRDKMGIVL